MLPDDISVLLFSAMVPMDVQAVLPPCGSLGTFKGADDLTGNPTSIKVTLLRLYLLAVDQTTLHTGRIEGEKMRERFIGSGWPGVGPGSIGGLFAIDTNRIVGSCAFPLTIRSLGGSDQIIHINIVGRKIVYRRMAGLQNAQGTPGISKDDSAKYHLKML